MKIADCHKTGGYFKKSKKKRRIEWLWHARNNALLEAQEQVAECYENGRETTRNDCKDFHWYKRATEKGSEIGKSKAELYEVLRFYP
jgi:TPR repeat protein